jgi:tetratricopeptide (TPR) repeat protein
VKPARPLPVLLLTAACAGSPAEAPAPPPPAAPARPDLLLISVDTLRADRVGAYGDPLARTPTMDGLAAAGALFRHAHTVTPLTLPAHATLLTGRLPRAHGLRDNAGFRLDAGVPTLAEALGAAGYATGGFVGAYVLDSAWGLDRGFAVWDDPFHPQDVAEAGAFGEVSRPGAEVVNAALAWWRAAPAPRFGFVHLYEPHAPWDPPADNPGGDPYRADVARADALLARLLAGVGKDTVVVLVSDHGEGLWDHGEREHGLLLSPSVTRIPLLVRAPAVSAGPPVPAGPPPTAADRRPPGTDPGLDLGPVPDAPRARRVIDGPVSIADVAPTLAALAGVPLPGTDGVDLSPALSGGAPPDRAITAETFFPLFHYGWAPLTMALDGTARLEVGVHRTLCAWTSDPLCAAAGPAPESHPLDAARLAARGEGDPRPGPISADTAAALAALGYTAAPAPAAGAPAPTTDPRGAIDRVARLDAAEAMEPAAAMAALRALLREDPGLFDAALALSIREAATGDLPAARATLDGVLARAPEHPLALANAAALARAAKDTPAALAYARRLQAINPHDPRGWRIEAGLSVDAGDARAVLRATEAGLTRAPGDPNLHYLAALAEIEAGDPLRAIPHLEAARKNGSRATDIDLWLGAAAQRAGQIDTARAHYDAALKSMPGDARPWAMAGWMLYKAQRCPEAWPYLVNVAKRGGAADPKVQEAVRACDPRARPVEVPKEGWAGVPGSAPP